LSIAAIIPAIHSGEAVPFSLSSVAFTNTSTRMSVSCVLAGPHGLAWKRRTMFAHIDSGRPKATSAAARIAVPPRQASLRFEGEGREAPISRKSEVRLNVVTRN
jgi:hypothetical protein